MDRGLGGRDSFTLDKLMHGVMTAAGVCEAANMFCALVGGHLVSVALQTSVTSLTFSQ